MDQSLFENGKNCWRYRPGPAALFNVLGVALVLFAIFALTTRAQSFEFRPSAFGPPSSWHKKRGPTAALYLKFPFHADATKTAPQYGLSVSSSLYKIGRKKLAYASYLPRLGSSVSAPVVSLAREAPSPYASLAQAAPGRITIGQAILIAEKEAGGEAFEAELDEENGTLIYEVDVLKDGEKFEVLIDPDTGEVLSIEKDD